MRLIRFAGTIGPSSPAALVPVSPRRSPWVPVSSVARCGAAPSGTGRVSNSTSSGLIPLVRGLATTKTRRRIWGTPKYWASRMRQAAVRAGPQQTPARGQHGTTARERARRVQYGESPWGPGGGPGVTGKGDPMSPPRKHPNALSCVDRTPGTFSHSATRGSSASQIRMYSSARLPRSSSRLRRYPLTENDWHGVPPTMMSGRSISAARSMNVRAVMSPRLGTSGCRYASTRHGNAPISEYHKGRKPNGAHATVAASTPEQRLP